jgi:hypothetical protein
MNKCRTRKTVSARQRLWTTAFDRTKDLRTILYSLICIDGVVNDLWVFILVTLEVFPESGQKITTDSLTEYSPAPPARRPVPPMKRTERTQRNPKNDHDVVQL